MSMTKKEKAEVEELRVRLALRWTDPVAPDVPPPASGSERTVGWNAHSWGDGWRVDERESSCIYNRSVARVADGYSGWTHGALALHSSRLRALRAVRHQMERKFAERLRQIDVEIEKEASK